MASRHHDTTLHALTGEFSDLVAEHDYRLARWDRWTARLRFVAGAGALFYLVGVVVDWYTVGPGGRLLILVAMRLVVALTLLVGTLVATAGGPSIARFDLVVQASLLVVATGTCAIIAVTGGEVVFHSLTVLVVLLVLYLFVPGRVLHIMVAAWVLSLGFVVAAVVRLRPMPEEMALALLYLVLIHCIGLYGSQMLHRSRRRAYAIVQAERAASEELRSSIESRAATERALAESEARHRSLVELSPNAIVVHREGRILYVNPRGLELVGADSEDEVLGRPVFEFILPEYHDLTVQRLNQLAATGRLPAPHEIEVQCLDGRITSCEVLSGATTFGGIPAVQSVIQDIGERKRLQDDLVRMASTDPLTGVSNRRHFFDHFEVEWARARRHRRSLSVLVLDVDHFKAVNDEHGHAVGDAVLIELVGLVRGLLRAEDLLARIGGEEFAAVLPEIDQAGAERAAQRIRRRVAAREFLERTEGLRLTVSIGVAQCHIADETPDESLKRADDALYAAKGAGRNRVCVG